MARVGFEPGSAWVHLQRSSPSSTLSPLEEKGEAGGYSGSSRPLTISLWDILETATKLHFYLVYINSNTCNLSLHPCVSLAGDVPTSREPPGTSTTQINFFPQFLLIPEATKPARQYFCNFLNPTEESYNKKCTTKASVVLNCILTNLLPSLWIDWPQYWSPGGDSLPENSDVSLWSRM